ncbi:zf-HC2 domain-containing protein [Streptomyces sp. V4-01]|uniref:Zf-HC2 domain-containing protein n=1 Tax=Actinacidiphila polyblastidii TaxID=3110430 RepID=A0ABU7PC64_9ACTN|nr:zf-HC2 domain-containing protein [Streptomyces sp. V4-01]
MSSSGSGEARPQRTERSAPAEQHLGDRLAAFVDGELTDDSRDRVLAHLATCPQCKAAATEQRRLKSVIAESELPAISAGLMARLQGLPGMGPGDGGFPGDPGGPGSPFAEQAAAARRGPFDGGLLGSGSGIFGSGRGEEFSFLGPAPDLTAPEGSRSRGFRIHQAIRAVNPIAPVTPVAPDANTPMRTGRDAHAAAAAAAAGVAPSAASRSRRFAFAAAGAFSMAAIAIGGALPMEAAVDGGARPDDGPAVSPLSASTNTVSDTRGVTPRGMLDAEERPTRRALPAAAVSASSVALARPLLTPGTVPLLTAASAPASQSSVVVH